MAAVLLWLVGIEVVPAAHLAVHDADHTHAADGSIVPHRHDDADHGAFLDHTGHTAIDHDAPDHAPGGFAHHAVALHQPPPPLLAVLVPRIERRDVATLASQLCSTPRARPTARGPPAA